MACALVFRFRCFSWLCVFFRGGPKTLHIAHVCLECASTSIGTASVTATLRGPYVEYFQLLALPLTPTLPSPQPRNIFSITRVSDCGLMKHLVTTGTTYQVPGTNYNTYDSYSNHMIPGTCRRVSDAHRAYKYSRAWFLVVWKIENRVFSRDWLGEADIT